MFVTDPVVPFRKGSDEPVRQQPFGSEQDAIDRRADECDVDHPGVQALELLGRHQFVELELEARQFVRRPLHG